MSEIDDEDKASEFDWDDDDCIVIREQRQIAAYANSAGDLVIRQCQWPHDDDAIIVVRRTDAPALVDALQRLLDIVEDDHPLAPADGDQVAHPLQLGSVLIAPAPAARRPRRPGATGQQS